MSNCFPNFLIIGAPKAGTTSLYKYLEQHTGIFMPTKKEPQFFCDYSDAVGPGSEPYNRNMVRESKQYEALFAGAKIGQLTGEASTDYLSCESSASMIKQWNPSCKIIAVLRNPIDRAYSEHMHLIRDCYENEKFSDALEMESARISLGYIPLFWHIKRGLYFEDVKRYIKFFGQDQVKIILFDDLVAEPEHTIRGIFSFLGLEHENISHFEKENSSGQPRFGFLQATYVSIRSLPGDSFIKRVVRSVTVRPVRQVILQKYLKLNVKKASQISAADRHKLLDIFRCDIENLGTLLKRDLSYWLQ